MPIVPNADALRRPLRSCAIGAVPLFVFLAAWQFLIPGTHSSPLAEWAFILAVTVCLSSGVGLAVSATRRLWRSTQRARSVLPAVFLVGVVFAFPSAASAAGDRSLIWLGSLLLALLLSAVFSAYLIITAKDAAPIPSPPTSFNPDDPDAYVSDIPGNRRTR
jgi:FtsH-binding integral membrane protein